MPRVVTRLLARGYGFLDGVLETAPVVIAQERLEVAGTPILGSKVVGLLEALEARGSYFGQVVFGHV